MGRTKMAANFRLSSETLAQLDVICAELQASRVGGVERAIGELHERLTCVGPRDGDDLWTGNGVWTGWRMTTAHAASSYGQPVLVDPDGTAFGAGDIRRRRLVQADGFEPP